jgi:two-component system, cell cycle sensor histidine kinase and response regulator CckA
LSAERVVKSGNNIENFVEVLHRLFDNYSYIVFAKDLNFRYFYFNKHFLDFYNFTGDDVLNHRFADLNTDVNIDVEKTDRLVIESISTLTSHLEVVRSDKVSYFHQTKSPILDQEGKCIGVLCIAQDITSETRQDMLFHANFELLDTIINNAPYVIFVKDLNGRYVKVNKMFSDIHLMSPDEAVGKTDFDFFPEDVALKYRARDRHMIENNIEYDVKPLVLDMRGKTFHTISVKFPLKDKDGKIIGIVGIVQDVTDFRHMEGKLFELNKMETIRTFTGGIAHDLNNLLTVVLGNTSLLKVRSSNSPKLSYISNNIHKAANNASLLIQKLVAFSKHEVSETEVIDVADILENSIELVRSNQSPHVKIRSLIENKDLFIKMDSSLISQSILNLLVNAYEAIPDEGEVIIELSKATITDNDLNIFTLISPSAVQGEYVKISVSDTGVGLTQNRFSKIFEPFYSSKDADIRSRGLGLTIVYTAVVEGGGVLNVESEENKGTQFHLYFPIHNITLNGSEPLGSEDIGLEQIYSSEIAAIDDIVTGDPNNINLEDEAVDFREDFIILVIDDDLSVREVLRSMFTRLGLLAVFASSGQEGLLIYQRLNPEIVMLDLIMPIMDGREVFKEIVSLNTEAKIIVSSAFANPSWLKEMRDLAPFTKLHKPYTIQDLERVIHQVIEEL